MSTAAHARQLRDDPVTREPWNHNLHYHPVILAAIPDPCERALDVGCGEGHLSRELRRRIPHVTAMDVDGATLGRARRHDDGIGVEYVLGDILTHTLEPAGFDFVVSVAALHHMDTAAALGRMAELVRPGGVLAVVGLASSRHPVDLSLDLVAALIHRVLLRRRDWREVTAPTVWPPATSYGDVRRIASRVIPGARYARRLLWRYALTWTRPTDRADLPVGSAVSAC